MAKGGFIYILTNKRNTTIYVGVTSELKWRIIEHREKMYTNSFTARYNLDKLVYYEVFDDIESAIDWEKQIKSWSRAKKNKLVETKNPDWKDLFGEIEDW